MISKGKDKQTRINIKYYSIGIIDHLDEIVSNKINFRGFKLYDKENIFRKVEIDHFKEYISRTPKSSNKVDISGLDQFLDDEVDEPKPEIKTDVKPEETQPIFFKLATCEIDSDNSDSDESEYFVPCIEKPVDAPIARTGKVILVWD
jgi:hypothetical protein